MVSSAGKFALIVLFTLLLIALVNAVWWFNYQRSEEMLDEQLGRRLAAVAVSAAVNFSPGEIDSLRYGSVNAYLDAISVLERVRQSDSLSEAFVLDENYFYLATTLLEWDSVYFLADVNSPQIDSVLLGLAPTACLTPTYRSGSLYLKTAFAPLFASDGLERAVLGVEANVDYFDALTELRRNLYYASGLSLLAGLVLGGLFLWWQRRMQLADQKLFLGETHAHLGRMVAVVAHELRNPLMIIRGSAERLVKKSGQEEARFVVEEVDRLNQIVTGYLDFARSGGSLLKSEQPGPIDLPALIAGTRKHLSEKYAEHKITWLDEPLPAGPALMGYERSLRQVLLNLLFNGVESCLAAGKPVQVGIRVAARDSTVRLTVIDHGGGLSRREQRRVFTPFYTTKQSGSGLGLYLSRIIVGEMGGSLTLKSTPGQGSEVLIHLPGEPKR